MEEPQESHEASELTYPYADDWHLDCDQDFLYRHEYGTSGQIFYRCPVCHNYFADDDVKIGFGIPDYLAYEANGFHDETLIRKTDDRRARGLDALYSRVAVARSKAILQYLLYLAHPEVHANIAGPAIPVHAPFQNLLADVRGIVSKLDSEQCVIRHMMSPSLREGLQCLRSTFALVPDTYDTDGLTRMLSDPKQWRPFAREIDDLLEREGVDVEAETERELRRGRGHP